MLNLFVSLTMMKSRDFIHPTPDRIAELLPDAQRKTITGQTHQAAPDAVSPLLIEFFGEEARSRR